MKRTGIKRAAALAMAAVLAAAGALGVHAEESRFGQPEFDLPCKAAVLMEQGSGTVLYAKNPDIQLPEASITKVMTLLLTFEALQAGKVHKEDLVPVSEHSYSMGGSQIWLEPGEQFTLDELLRAVCVSSANDAAVAVAEFIGGSETVFVEQMNRRAAELGMNNTHFVNCTGLPAEGHLTTARDIAIMSRELILNHPAIREFTTIWMDTLRDGAFQLSNTNKLIYYYEGATGLKTGSTDAALYCLSATAERDGMELIAAVMHAPTSKDRFESAKALLNYGFAGYALLSVWPDGPIPPVRVELGEGETVQPVPARACTVLVEKAKAGAMSTELVLPDSLEAPVAEGERIGTLEVYVDGERVDAVELVAAEGVGRLTVGKIFKRFLGTLLLRGN